MKKEIIFITSLIICLGLIVFIEAKNPYSYNLYEADAKITNYSNLTQSFLAIDGSNANQDIDIGDNDFITDATARVNYLIIDDQDDRYAGMNLIDSYQGTYLRYDGYEDEVQIGADFKAENFICDGVDCFLTVIFNESVHCGLGWKKGDVKVSFNQTETACWKNADGTDGTYDMRGRATMGIDSTQTYWDTIGEKDGTTNHFHTFSFSGGGSLNSGSGVASGSGYSPGFGFGGGGATAYQYVYYEHGGSPINGGKIYHPYITVQYQQCICDELKLGDLQ